MTILIGHGGAGAIFPANTIESFEAARRAGVDMIEFDVRPRGSRLLVAHLAPQARLRGCLTLDDALDHLARPRFSRIALNVDVKGSGCESALVGMLRGRGLLERSLISSQSADIVEAVRTVAPDARTAISIGGHVSRRANRWHPRSWRERLLQSSLRAASATRCCTTSSSTPRSRRPSGGSVAGCSPGPSMSRRCSRGSPISVSPVSLPTTLRACGRHPNGGLAALAAWNPWYQPWYRTERNSPDLSAFQRAWRRQHEPTEPLHGFS